MIFCSLTCQLLILGLKVSNYDSGFVYFSFQFYQFFLHLICSSTAWYMHSSHCSVFSWIDPLSLIICLLSSLFWLILKHSLLLYFDVSTMYLFASVFKKIIVFIYFWLCWVFVAVWALCGCGERELPSSCGA